MPTSSSVSTQHPLYADILPDWTIVRDFAAGQRQVKQKGVTYLPPTSAMRQKGFVPGAVTKTEGHLLYDAYICRAVVAELVRPAVNALVGVMHREPAEITLPAAMEAIRDNATLEGESLQTLLRRINKEQLETGRIGLLVDVPVGDAGVLPYIVSYDAEKIINWDCSRRPDGRERPDLVVLDETGFERSERFTWQEQRKFLVLDLVTPGDIAPDTPQSVAINDLVEVDDSEKTYRSQLILQNSVTEGVTSPGLNRQTSVNFEDNPQAEVFPNIAGRSRSEIPFVFIGSTDMTAAPDQVPMLPLANLAHAIYLGEADYRNTLFQQGQATMIIIGDTQGGPTDTGAGKIRVVGASASIDLPLGADAKYIGAPADGIGEQRQSLENDRARASELGSNVLSNIRGGGGGGGREAAESLKIRVAARTATLMSIVTSGAEGLQASLRIMAEWMGANPDEVVVTPNTDFVEDEVPTSDLVDLTTAKSNGAPISQQTIHQYMKTKDLTTMTFEEELAAIQTEEPLNPGPRPGDNPDPDEEARRLAGEEDEDEVDDDDQQSSTEDNPDES